MRLLPLVFLLFVAGCLDLGPQEPFPVVQSNRKYVKQIVTDNRGLDFIYNGKNELMEVRKIETDTLIAHFNYENSRVVEYTLYGKNYFITYEENGLISVVRESLGKQIQFEYDSLGQLRSTTYLNGTLGEDYSQQIEWKDGNIVKLSYFEDDIKQVEYAYEFDDKINFRRGNPFYLNDLINSLVQYGSKNNITKISALNALPNIDPPCFYPCLYSYTYDNDGYPVTEEYFRLYEIKYERFPL